MASSRSRHDPGPQAPLFDFDARALDGMPAGDTAALEAGRLEAVAYTDVELVDWRVPLGDMIDGCRFDGVRAQSWTIRGVRLAESVIERADIPVVSAARTDARDLIVSDSRLGSIEAYDASWRGIRFLRCRLGFVNLRGADLMDIAFEDCTVDEIDLLDAKARRVSFTATGVRSLNVTGAALADVDLRGAQLQEIVGLPGLRGATISETQLQQMAPALAALAGVDVL
ncbi:pentapeptide repeat-containing protein [Microbacterium hominis]|uniref:Pentapeptide repeat-containing protein n=1 Tax=Microbacterium hominis TaxID=162426 RepID=A0A7D4TDE4_9MICO|nr:pentapeptide repeat-containing protein [Microbacterium hominis]QKJ18020.1 pentapeptide repeat-containing protein [Microbacterium hominis]